MLAVPAGVAYNFLVDWLALQALESTCAEGSFSRAGRRLLLSHTSVSERVTRLERALGVRLVDRSPVRVTPTAAGRAVLAHYGQAAREWAALTRRLPHLDGDGRGGSARRTLRLGLAPLDTSRAFVETVNALAPDLDLTWESEISHDTLIGQLVDGEHDAVVTVHFPGQTLPQPPGLSQFTLIHEPMWILLGEQHPRARQATLTLDELVDDLWVVSVASHPAYEWEVRELKAAGVTRIRAVVHGAAVEQMLHDDAVGFAAPLHQAAPGLTVRPLTHPARLLQYTLVWDPLRVEPNVARVLADGYLMHYRDRARTTAIYREWLEAHPEALPAALLPVSG